MASLIGTDLSTIAKAVETALLAAGNVEDLSNIYWVEGGEVPPPGKTGQHDLLLYQLDDDFEGSQSSTVVGSGRGAAIRSGMSVAIRSSLATDRGGTRKNWFVANEELVSAVLDTLMVFFPEDADGNALTIEGFVPTKNTSPAREKDVVTWGYELGSFSFHYIPALSSVTP